MMKQPKLLLFVLLHSLPGLVSSFSAGAGGCGSGSAATGHGEKTGSLSDGDFELVLDDSDVLDAATVPLELGTEYALTVRSTADATQIRGVLFRVESDSMFELVEKDDLQVAGICMPIPNVIGITHTSSADKEEVETDFTPLEEGTYTLDVTIVVSQSPNMQYHDTFTFVVEADVDTEAPTVSPTGTPTVSPTMGPTESPTVAPVMPPIDATDTPVMPPMDATDAPVMPPMDATDAPVMTPMDPTDAPVPAPTPDSGATVVQELVGLLVGLGLGWVMMM